MKLAEHRIQWRALSKEGLNLRTSQIGSYMAPKKIKLENLNKQEK
jgi:hypothetical protein